MTGSRRESERSPLLGARVHAGVSPSDLDDSTFVHDELPIVTCTNTFPLTSPSYAGALDVVKPRHFDEEQGQEAMTPQQEQALEPEPVLMEEFRRSLSLIYPVVITYTLEYIPGLVVIMLVGHMESPDTAQYVAAATLSTMFTNMSALSIGFGLSSALDTLCAQAYGAQKLMNIGIYLQSAAIVVGACLLPIFLLNWHCGTFLMWVGQDPKVSRLAGEFSRITIFGVPFLFVYEMFRKLLQAQNIVRPMLVLAILGNLVNIVGGYYLTYYTAMGFHGAALSRTIGYIVLPVCMVPYFIVSGNHKQWWPGWNLRLAWERVPLFLHLGLPALAMMCMEWWAYEILAVLAGNLPDGVMAVSAHAVLMNVAATTSTIYTGISVSGNIRVGNCLGANEPKKAAVISRLMHSMVFALSFLFSALILIYRHQIPTIILNDPAAVDYAATTLLVMGPYQIIDALNKVMQGIYRGTGWQNHAAKINIWVFYGLGLPSAAVLAFYFNLGVMGLWIGFGMGHTLSFTICSLRLYKSSWGEIALEAQARVAH